MEESDGGGGREDRGRVRREEGWSRAEERTIGARSHMCIFPFTLASPGDFLGKTASPGARTTLTAKGYISWRLGTSLPVSALLTYRDLFFIEHLSSFRYHTS